MRIICCLMMLFSFAGQYLQAQGDTIFITDTTLEKPFDISASIQWLSEADRTVSFPEIQKAVFNDTLTDTFPFHPDLQNWMRFSLQNVGSLDTIRFLLCTNPFSQLNLYLPKKKDTYLAWTNGKIINYANRSYTPNKDCLPIKLSGDTVHTYYLQVYDFFKRGTFELPLKLITRNEEIARRQAKETKDIPRYLFNGVFLGIVFFMAVFSAFQFFHIRDKSLLFYALYLIGNFLFYLRILEGGNQPVIFFSYFMSYYPNIEVQTSYFIYIFYLFFVKYFLDLSRKQRSLNRHLNWSIYGFIILIFVDAGIQFLWGARASYMLFSYVRVIFFGIIGLMIFIMLIKIKSRLSNYLVVGTGFLLLGGLGTLIQQLVTGRSETLFHGIFRTIHTPYFTLYLFRMKTGILLEIFCFSLGLNYKYKMRLEEEFVNREKVAAAERIQQLDEFKTRFYTNITHEFRTPLSVILGLTDWTKEQLNQISKEKLVANLKMISRNGRGLLQLINQLLDLSKIEAGKLQVQPVQGEIIQYLKYLTDAYRSLAERKQIQVHFIDLQKDIWMDFDPEKIQQIFSNLFSNAVKFTPNGGTIYILPETDVTKQLFILKIKDTGIGIPSKDIKMIFSRFDQVVQPVFKKEGGTGIGLALTNELIHLMEGSIAVESEEGKGTVFEIQLPIYQQARLMEELPPTDWDASIDSSSESGMFISTELNVDKPLLLLIEDNQDVRNLIREMLKGIYEIIEVVDGQEGVETAFEKIPDIVISDIMMPQKDGFEVCQILKSDNRTSHIPIILLTAKADMNSKLQGLEYGADAYLSKPFERKELLLRLRKLLELRQVLRERYQDLSQLLPDQDPLLAKEDAFVKEVRVIIEANIANVGFGVENISSTIFKSRTQVHRKLKALTGLATGEFIHHVRLYHAKEMILNKNKSITQIAYDCGYRELAYFSRLFTKKFGVTPSSLRK